MAGRRSRSWGAKGGRRPNTRGRLCLFLFARPSLSGRAAGIGLGQQRRRDWGRQRGPSRAQYAWDPEPRRQSPGTKPRGAEPHEDYKAGRRGRRPRRTPSRLVTMWRLLIWTLVALYRIREAGAQGTGDHPHVGLGGGSERGRAGGGQRVSVLSLDSPLLGVSRPPPPQVWGLSFGWGMLSETCGFRMGKVGSPEKAEKTLR